MKNRGNPQQFLILQCCTVCPLFKKISQNVGDNPAMDWQTWQIIKGKLLIVLCNSIKKGNALAPDTTDGLKPGEVTSLRSRAFIKSRPS